MQKEARYFVKFIEELLKQHYDKMGSSIHLYLYQKLSDSVEWRCLSEEKGLGEEFIKTLSSFDEKGTLENVPKQKNNVVYRDIQNEFCDSRISGDGVRSRLYWIWTSDRESESSRFVLKIFTDELKDKISDMLYLERIHEIVSEPEEISDELWNDLKKHKVYQYFFGNLMDKDWITRKIVNLSLSEYRLPEWRAFLQISAMFYEKRTVSTCMYFLEKNEDISNQYRVEFSKEGNLRHIGGLESCNFRTIRKLMEMSGPNHGLALRKPNFLIEGIVPRKQLENEKIYIEFAGHLIWRLKRKSEVIFEYNKGEYKLPELDKKDDGQMELDKLERLPCSKKQKKLICSAIKKIRKVSSHGTSIIFMDDTTLNIEIERLESYNRAYKIKEFNLKDCIKKLPEVLAIDGALLVGMDCCCRAVGVIVDGELKRKGRVDRGARYNSLVNYVHVLKEREEKEKETEERDADVFCCAVIISEDRMINVEIP